MGDTEQLRELHDSYLWKVNAAVGVGRLDVVSQLADQYFDEALALINGRGPATCGAAGCAVCTGSRSAVAKPSHRRWRRARGSAAG